MGLDELERFALGILSLIERVRDVERAARDANAHVDELRQLLAERMDGHDTLALNQSEEARHMRNA